MWTPRLETHAHAMREANEQSKHPGPRARTFPMPAEPWWERRIEYLINRGFWDKDEMAALLKLRMEYLKMLNGGRKR